MPFCINCGQQIVEGAKFCHFCGSSQTGVSSNTQREIVFEGTIHKCPFCGEFVESLNTKCPSCGNEFRDKKIDESLQKFIDEITKWDISNENNNRNNQIPIPLIIIIIYTTFSIVMCCVPLPLLPILIWILSILPYKLSTQDKIKETLIKNYIVPNERESILELLLFIKQRVDYISSNKTTCKNQYLIELWTSKATQIYSQADAIIKSDDTANQIYNSILDKKNNFTRKRIKKIVCLGIISIFITIGMIITPDLIIKKRYSDEIKNAKVLVIPDEGLYEYLPEINDCKGKILYEDEERIKIEIIGVTEEQFEDYITECKENGFNLDMINSESSFDAKNQNGYNLSIYKYSNKMDIELDSYDAFYDITIDLNIDDIKNKNIEDVVIQLEKLGFTNIKTIAKKDLITGWVKNDGNIESIKIDGEEITEFEKSYCSNVEIIITYHTFIYSKSESEE